MPPLLAVPNASAGRDAGVIEAIATAFSGPGAELLDTHSDAVHDRSVFTLASSDEQALGDALMRGANACIGRIDIREQEGAHPRIGALDVCPVVWLDAGDIEAAAEVALAAAQAFGELGVPVFLYGELASTDERRERAYFRRGGPVQLAERMRTGELPPDFGPETPHRTAGATLVTARAPLAAFNVVLEGATPEQGDAIAAKVREAGGGLPGVRAIAIALAGAVQISTNVHDPVAVPLREVVTSIREAAGESRLTSAEIVGLVPAAALDGFPEELPIAGFDRSRGVIEARLG